MMDDQDILKMKDDQSMDALVAEMVMGEPKPDYIPDDYLELKYGQPDHPVACPCGRIVGNRSSGLDTPEKGVMMGA